MESIVSESIEPIIQHSVSALQRWIQHSRRGARTLMNGKRRITFPVPSDVQEEIGRQNVVIDALGVRHPANYQLVYCDRQTLDQWLSDAQI